MRDGHIAGVEMLPHHSDEEAIKKSEEMFAARAAKRRYDGFELWDMERFITRYPLPAEIEESPDSTDSGRAEE